MGLRWIIYYIFTDMYRHVEDNGPLYKNTNTVRFFSFNDWSRRRYLRRTEFCKQGTGFCIYIPV